MLKIAVLAFGFVAIAGPASAQARFYVGGALAADSGSRGPVDVGTIPAAGGLVGWRFADDWSVEFHIDRAFGDGPPRTFQGLLFAQSGSTPAERERTGVFGQSVWQDSPGPGWAVLAVYKARSAERVGVSVYTGVSERRFEARQQTTITGLGPDVTYPPEHPNLQNRSESLTLRAGGLTGGVMVPIRVAGALSVAPELRVTLGLITDESTYKQFYSGIRVMWGF